ncbi:hypothetical protein BaRGS_00013866 [Batillaria attramentaria]|uniref:Uncharacterized protein n=1 Tax=Batillaria attramentaria TaxID=370345 RepID=A0ABD0L6A2_9CAEN
MFRLSQPRHQNEAVHGRLGPLRVASSPSTVSNVRSALMFPLSKPPPPSSRRVLAINSKFQRQPPSAIWLKRAHEDFNTSNASGRREWSLPVAHIEQMTKIAEPASKRLA